jgi:DNA-binding transcriptional LysR family regulator
MRCCDAPTDRKPVILPLSTPQILFVNLLMHCSMKDTVLIYAKNTLYCPLFADSICGSKTSGEVRMYRKLRKLHSSAFTYFMSVAAEGSFRGAARKLRIASSAVNRHVLLLEDELGFALFERHGRAVALSRAGEVLFRHCKATVQSFEAAIEELDALRELRSGIVRIAASESFAAEIVPQICVQFADAYPGIRIHVTVADSAAVIEAIEKDECDVGFAFGRITSKAIRTVTTVNLPIGAVVGPRHPFARKRGVTIAECFNHPIVLPDAKLSFRQRLDEVTDLFSTAAAAGVEASSPRLMVGIARLDRHVAFQTRIGITGDLAGQSLVFLPLTDKKLKPDSCAILASSRNKERFAAKTFCEFSTGALEKILRAR